MDQLIILVHGAWMDASCWDHVVAMLENLGSRVTVVNLPGHGQDDTPYGQIGLQSYVDTVRNAVGDSRHVFLVGYSMAGRNGQLAGSRVGSRRPAGRARGLKVTSGSIRRRLRRTF